MDAMVSVALVLGSGGARGYAHIGVINELVARGHQVVGVSGSSMGALVGGLQAAGQLDAFTEWATSLTQRAVLRLLDPSLSAAGVFRAEKILDAVRDIVGDIHIEQLPVPYTAVATDLIAGRPVWLQRGRLDQAIRASIAIPGVIAPHVVNGRLLADGGIVDPLPMAPIAAVHADLTIAVNLSGRSESPEPSEADATEPGPTAELLSRVLRSTSSLLDTDAARSVLDSPTARAMINWFGGPDNSEAATDEEAEESAAGVPKLGSFEVMNRTIEISQAVLTRYQLAGHPPDLLIEVPRTACRSLEFHRAAEMIDVGRELARQAL